MKDIIDSILSEPLLLIFVILFFVLVILLIFFVSKYIKEKRSIYDSTSKNDKKENIVENNKSSELEALLLKMENDLKEHEQNIEQARENKIKTFEEEQEENAIISYQELLAANNKLPKEEVITETIETLDLTNEIEEKKQEETKEAIKKFKSTDFISPVYGIIDNKKNLPNKVEISKDEIYNTPTLEQTLNIKPLSDEIKKNDEFLKALKELRKNL